jgi:hypothetical protein
MGIPKQNAQNHDYGRINHGKEDIEKLARGLKGRRAILPWYPVLFTGDGYRSHHC